jgi:ABC-type transporter Mla MlaB component
MSDPTLPPPQGDNFLRKVARFVSNPATDWANLSAITEESRDLELEKSELKSMIERKRRNDFVRRREFDMLRKVRREGLSPEQLAALGSSSRLDDSEGRASDVYAPIGRGVSQGVKAKIDAIEKQMVGGGTRPTPLRDESPVSSTSPGVMGRSGNQARPTEPVPLASSPRPPASLAAQVPTLGADDEAGLPALPRLTADPSDLEEEQLLLAAHRAAAIDRPPVLQRPGDTVGAGFAAPGGPPAAAAALPPSAALSGGLSVKPSPTVATSIAATAVVRPSATAPSVHTPSRKPAVQVPASTFPNSELTLGRTRNVSVPSNDGATPAMMAAGLPPLSSAAGRNSQIMPLNSPFDTVEVGEVVHDPELDPAVICFANADFDDCERTLTSLVKPHGSRVDHAETWLVLFDLYRATGQHAKFESLALDYAQRFNASSPQWYSLPKMVADTATLERPRLSRTRGEIGWVCGEVLDMDGVAKLGSTVLQLPLPWVLDWSALRSVEPQAAAELSKLMRQWAPQQLEMRWLSGERFFQVLQEVAPSGARDSDPALWLVQLDALRLANRPDQFDDIAIEYCITYEVSPPSWEPARALARIGGAGLTTQSPPLSQVSAVHTALTTMPHDDESSSAVRVATLDLAGQLVGDIAATLARLNDELDTATIVKVSCTRLIRVDFVAAGDLLNWVLAKRQEGRQVSLVDTHRLVALFFGAMGINEHASVRVRMV